MLGLVETEAETVVWNARLDAFLFDEIEPPRSDVADLARALQAYGKGLKLLAAPAPATAH